MSKEVIFTVTLKTTSNLAADAPRLSEYVTPERSQSLLIYSLASALEVLISLFVYGLHSFVTLIASTDNRVLQIKLRYNAPELTM